MTRKAFIGPGEAGTQRCNVLARSAGIGALLFGGVSALAIGGAAYAQEPQAESEIVVVGDPVGLREGRSTDSIFGYGATALETPRSFSVVSDVTMDRYAIQDIDDFITTTPGTFGGSFFGVPGAISVRGSITETYFRAFKRALNQGLFPTPIGASERVEIIRGPVPVIYGGGRVGGLLNFYPATAASRGMTAAEGVSGSLAYTGGSYSKNNAAGELNIPFQLGGREAGFSFYGEYEDSESFYRGREPQHRLIQGAFNAELSDNWSFELGGMYFNSEGYFQTPGWNRITQSLIDNGTYITGRDTEIPDTDGNGELSHAEIDAVVGTFFGTSNIRQLVDFGSFPSSAFGLDTGVGTAQLDPRNVFLAPGHEVADAETVTFYADLVGQFGDSTFKFQLFRDTLDGELNVTYGFAAQHVVGVSEVRASYNFKHEFSEDAGVDVYLTGSYRDYDSVLREQFLAGYLVLDRRDLVNGPTATDIFATPVTDPTIAWETNVASDWSDAGIALVTDWHFGGLNIILGGRYDEYEVSSVDTGVTNFGTPTSGEASEGDFSYSASVNYVFPVGIAPYVTYAEGSEPAYNSNGGVYPADAASGDILRASELMEGGIKYALLDGSLNGSLAYYEQTRSIADAFGNVDEETGKGVEFEMRYLITDNWTLTAAATFQEFSIAPPGTCPGNGEFVVISPMHPASQPTFGAPFASPAEGYGGLFAALNAACLPDLINGYDRETIPDTVVSSFVTYTSSDMGGTRWGATLGATFVSETGGKTVTGVTLPEYINTRASGFFEIGHFTLTAAVDNLFDEDYFQPLQGVYEEVAVLPGTGREFRITGKVKF